ncbi:cytochrome oxidase subunit III [Fusarium oxysporum II5]|nr:cytochrome oxidase subunit III [Fusarium oxysporum II5]
MHSLFIASWSSLCILLISENVLVLTKDIIAEGTYLGNHTLAVQKGLNLGVILFIVSEEPVNPFELPLLNTVILLSSGATITYAHHSLIKGERRGALYGSIFTVLLALIFTFFQGVEYSVSSFTISDGVFGTCFFFGTGFHGLHVIIDHHHLGYEAGILY